MPSLATVMSSLYQARRELPQCLRLTLNLTYQGNGAATLNGESFVLVDDGENDKIVIFGM